MYLKKFHKNYSMKKWNLDSEIQNFESKNDFFNVSNFGKNKKKNFIDEITSFSSEKFSDDFSKKKIFEKNSEILPRETFKEQLCNFVKNNRKEKIDKKILFKNKMFFEDFKNTQFTMENDFNK